MNKYYYNRIDILSSWRVIPKYRNVGQYKNVREIPGGAPRRSYV